MDDQLVTKIIEQIASINQQTDHLDKAYQAMSNLADTDSAVEQSEAIVEIIRERESTNRKALSLLEKMLDNYKPAKDRNSQVVAETYKMQVIENLIEHNDLGQNTDLIREFMQDL